MLLLVFLIFGLVLAFVIIGIRNKIYRSFVLLFISIATMLLCSVIYSAKISYYPHSSDWDYKIFLMLLKINIPFNILYITYLSSLCMYMIFPLILYSNFRKIKLGCILWFVIPVFVFAYVNLPEFSWDLYLKQSSLIGIKKSIIDFIITFIKVYNNVTIVSYMIIPLVLFIRYYANTKLRFKKESVVYCMICLALMDILVSQLIYNENIYMISINNLDLMKMPLNEIKSGGMVMTHAFTMFVIAVAFLLIVLSRPFKNFKMVRKSSIFNNYNMLNKNLYMILHRYKNAFLGLENMGKISLESLETMEYEHLEETLNMIVKTSSNQMHSIQNILEVISSPITKCEIVDIKKCVLDVCEGFCLSGNHINIKTDFCSEDVFIIGDNEQMKEVFINLLNNSANALSMSDNAMIKITVSTESQYIVIDFEDNGKGMDKETLKNIFVPLYSSKPQKEIGGLGLVFVEKIVKIHNGEIDVKSEVGKGTIFRIALPMMRSSVIKKMRGLRSEVKYGKSTKKDKMGNL